MKRKIRVLYAASECSRYAGTGGLGEVADSLPAALKNENIDIRRVLPLHSGSKCSAKYKWDFPVKIGDHYETCMVKYDQDEKEVPTYFICNDRYFNREKIYGYYDDGERYLFFCKAVIQLLEVIPFKPDIIHCNDWHTGFIPLFVKSEDLNIKTLFTIHNLKYQGTIGVDYLLSDKIDSEKLMKVGYPDVINFMKSGVVFSDYISTPSPSYAEEILTEEYGEGLEGLLNERKERIYGILNGINEEEYNPENPEDLAFPYNYKNISLKEKNKKLLKEELGLETENTDKIPLIAAVTRLDDQKGIDLIIQSVEALAANEEFRDDFQFVIMGSGNPYYERILGYISNAYPGKITSINEYDEKLAKKIYAASDIYLMPSKYEPCGLSQLYAMRYGSIPIVRNTGGLKDTVTNYLKDTKNGTGFTFDLYTPEALTETLTQAIKIYHTPQWPQIIKNAMQKDSTWQHSATLYKTHLFTL